MTCSFHPVLSTGAGAACSVNSERRAHPQAARPSRQARPTSTDPPRMTTREIQPCGRASADARRSPDRTPPRPVCSAAGRLQSRCVGLTTEQSVQSSRSTLTFLVSQLLE